MVTWDMLEAYVEWYKDSVHKIKASRLWRDYISFRDGGGRKPLPFYGIREVHRGNLNQAHADKLWQEHVEELNESS